MNLKAQDLMSTCDLVTVKPRATLGQLDAILTENLISGTPVINAGGELVGVVSQSDIIRFIYRVLNQAHSLDLCPGRAGREGELSLDQEIRSTEVWEVMQHRVHTVSPETDFETIARIMRTQHIHRVFVVDAENHLLGIITATDLLYPLEDPQWLRGILENARVPREEIGLRSGLSAGSTPSGRS